MALRVTEADDRRTVVAAASGQRGRNATRRRASRPWNRACLVLSGQRRARGRVAGPSVDRLRTCSPAGSSRRTEQKPPSPKGESLPRLCRRVTRQLASHSPNGWRVKPSVNRRIGCDRAGLSPQAAFGLGMAVDSTCDEAVPSTARRPQAHTGTNLYPSSQRLTLPVDGDGKCATHISVGWSQKRSNTWRRVCPACRESWSARMPSSG
jgi:hypothetical protein